MDKPATLAHRMWLRLQPPGHPMKQGQLDPWTACPLYMLRQDMLSNEQYKGYCDMLLRMESDARHPMPVRVYVHHHDRHMLHFTPSGWRRIILAGEPDV